MSRIKAGLQLYSVREAMQFEPKDTLRRVAQAGYRFVEIWDANGTGFSSRLYGMSAATVRGIGLDLGLDFAGAQVANVTLATADDILDFYSALGCTYLSIPVGYFVSPADLRAKAVRYAQLGRMAAERGMRVLYVNHYHEFEKLGGDVILDVLLEETDPESFGLAFNPYWAMRGLNSPIEMFVRYAARIIAIEQQDFPLDEISKFSIWEFGRHHPIAARTIARDRALPEGTIENVHPLQCRLFAEVGSGILPVRDLVTRALEARAVEFFWLRQDYTRMDSEFDSVLTSFEMCRGLPGLRWS